VSTWSEGALPSAEVRRIVADGYDEMGERFDRWADAAIGSQRDAYVRRLFDLVQPGGSLLEIGCGSGARSTETLASRFRLTGIDLSPRQIERARRRIPSASFSVGDVATVDLPPSAFAAIVAFYVMGHVASRDHAEVYARIATWLEPGGTFVANLPISGGSDGIEDGYLGVRMFFASFGAEENLRLIQEAGLELIDATIIDEVEVDPDDGSRATGTWQWVVATRRLDERPR
jgi:SAM-dependent methyltransferase